MKKQPLAEAPTLSNSVRKRALIATKLAGIGLLANQLAGCGYLTNENPPANPEPVDYTIEKFVEKREADECPVDGLLRFVDISISGPDTRGIYTMSKDGNPNSNVEVTFQPPVPNVDTINIVQANVNADCALQVTAAQ